MDLTLITGAASALKTAVDLGKTAVEIRDTIKLQGVITSMNEQILNAQQDLFAHNAALLELQQEHAKLTRELTQANDALAERGRYFLFDLGHSQFALRANARTVGEETESAHYVCQPCFEGPEKRKVVLKFKRGQFSWYCSGCKESIYVSVGPNGEAPERGLVGESARASARMHRLP